MRRVIKHIVMLHLREGYDAALLQSLMSGLSVLRIAGFTSFKHGPNRDIEGKSANYPYGFIATFDDLSALHRYAVDPSHQALGARLVEMCEDGHNGIMVMDIDV